MDSRQPPSVSSHSTYVEEDPFADGNTNTRQRLQFSEPQHPYPSSRNLSPASMPRPFESSSSIPGEFGGHGQFEEDEVEKQPLTAGQAFTGGFYPPG